MTAPDPISAYLDRPTRSLAEVEAQHADEMAADAAYDELRKAVDELHLDFAARYAVMSAAMQYGTARYHAAVARMARTWRAAS